MKIRIMRQLATVCVIAVFLTLTYTRCFYKQEIFGKFTVSTTIKGSSFSCPYSIQYNPVTGKWKR